MRYLEKQARCEPARGVLGIDTKRVLPDGTERLSGIDLKFTPFARLRTLLEASAFDLVGAYGSWRRDALDAHGADVVVETRTRTSFHRRGTP